MGDGIFVLLAARETTDQAAAGQFDVEEQQDADGDDDERPEKAVYGVRLRVDLVVDGVITRLRVVETAERRADGKPTDVPVDLGLVFAPCLVTDAQ